MAMSDTFVICRDSCRTSRTRFREVEGEVDTTLEKQGGNCFLCGQLVTAAKLVEVLAPA